MLSTCCCGLFSVRSASYCVAFYACIYFLVMLTISALGLISVQEQHELLASHPDLMPPDIVTIGLLSAMTALSALGIISAGMLVVGLCKARAWLLVPVICSLSATIAVDLVAVVSITVQDMLSHHMVDGTAVTLLLLDVMTMAVNLWCIVCVVSQYRIYRTMSSERAEHSSILRMPLTTTPRDSANTALASPTTLARSASCRKQPPPAPEQIATEKGTTKISATPASV